MRRNGQNGGWQDRGEKTVGQKSLFMLCGWILWLGGCQMAGTESAQGVSNSLTIDQTRSRYHAYLAAAAAPNGMIWAVGQNGVIVVSQDHGQTWTPQRSGVARSLFGVSFPTAKEGWVVGARGAILHTADSGATWTVQHSGTEKELLAVHFLDATHGWAVGAAGVMLVTQDGGQQWQDRSLSTDVNLNDIYFLDAQTGWVVGEYGTVLKTADGGSTWEQVAGNIPDAGRGELSWEELMSNPDVGAGGAARRPAAAWAKMTICLPSILSTLSVAGQLRREGESF